MPGDRLRQAFVIRKRRGNLPQTLDRLDVGPALRHRVEPAGIGEGVEVDRPVVAELTSPFRTAWRLISWCIPVVVQGRQARTYRLAQSMIAIR